jgi:hypothetical protein
MTWTGRGPLPGPELETEIALERRQSIDGPRPDFALDLQLESIGQQRPQHQAHLFLADFGSTRGGNVEALDAYPVRTAG